MMPVEVTNTVSWPTLAALSGIFITLVTLIWKGGGRSATVDAAVMRIKDLEECLRNLKTDRANDREKDRINLDGNLASLHAGVSLLKERVSELRNEVSAHYATKEESSAVEQRVNSVITRIFSHIDQIQERMGAMETRIIQAISDNRRP